VTECAITAGQYAALRKLDTWPRNLLAWKAAFERGEPYTEPQREIEAGP
jgi:hypothetical protein